MTSNTDSTPDGPETPETPETPEPATNDVSGDHSAEPGDEGAIGATSATEQSGTGTTEKDPGDWVTGDEPMTGAQRSYLDTLARDAGETLRGDLSKAEASAEIDRLQGATGRDGGS